MTSVNVNVEHFQKGKLVEVRQVHNVMTLIGRSWLSQLVGYADPALLTPETSSRFRFFGMGIGSVKASVRADGPDMLAAYPPGFDPNATNGHQYQTIDPTGPVISTLERPIRRSGTQNPYDTAPGTDLWLYGDIPIFFQDTRSITFRIEVDATSGEVIYGTFTSIPVTEAALFLGTADPNVPYNSAAAYVHFDTVQVTESSILLFSWSIRF
jgi:hypothetical protein